MPPLLQVPVSSLKQHFNFSCFNTFHWLSSHPHHPTQASIHPTILLDTEYWKVLPSVFGRVWEARRWLIVINIWGPWEFQHLSFGLSVILHLLTRGSLFCGSSLHLKLKVCCSWQQWLCQSSAKRMRRWVKHGLCFPFSQQRWRDAADLWGVFKANGSMKEKLAFRDLWQDVWLIFICQNYSLSFPVNAISSK